MNEGSEITVAAETACHNCLKHLARASVYQNKVSVLIKDIHEIT